jgi:hypothetical protein
MNVMALDSGVADRRGHVDGAVLLVEPVRGLDLAHLVARRHIHGEQRLDSLFFLDRRFEEIRPQELVRKRGRGRMLDPGVAAAGWDQ